MCRVFRQPLVPPMSTDSTGAAAVDLFPVPLVARRRFPFVMPRRPTSHARTADLLQRTARHVEGKQVGDSGQPRP